MKENYETFPARALQRVPRHQPQLQLLQTHKLSKQPNPKQIQIPNIVNDSKL